MSASNLTMQHATGSRRQDRIHSNARKYNMSEDFGFGDECAEWPFAIPTRLTIVLGMSGRCNKQWTRLRGGGLVNRDSCSGVRVGGKVCKVGCQEPRISNVQSLGWRHQSQHPTSSRTAAAVSMSGGTTGQPPSSCMLSSHTSACLSASCPRHTSGSGIVSASFV